MENLLTKEPDLQSRAAQLLLREQFRNDSNCDTRQDYQVWLDFREVFLDKVLKNKGDLVCEYCHRQGLQKNTKGVTSKDQATIDHKYPLARGGERYNEDNLAVACRSCNEKKADKV